MLQRKTADLVGKKNIIIYTTQPNVIKLSELKTKGCSGTVYSYLLLAREFAKHGHRVIILSSVEDCIDGEIIFKNIAYTDEIVNFINSYTSKIDIIIGVSYSAELFEKIHYENALKIFWWHNAYTSNFFTLTKLAALGKIDKIIGVGQYQVGLNFGHILRESFKYKINIVRRISIISNPVDSALFPEYTFHPKKENKIAFIGNPSKEKGFHLVVKVFAELKKKYPDLKLGVFGGGKLHSSNDLIDKDYYNEHLSGILKDDLIKNGVVFHGVLNREELYKELQSYKVALLGLNGMDTFCIAACESCGCGVPVVSRITGGQAHFLKKIGYLGKSNDEVTSYVEEILNMDYKKRKKLESKCLDLNDEFNPGVIYNNWIKEINRGKSTRIFNTFINIYIAVKERLFYNKDKFQ